MPCATEVGNSRRWIFGIEVLQQLGTTWQGPTFFLKNHSTLYTTVYSICTVYQSDYDVVFSRGGRFMSKLDRLSLNSGMWEI